jgi:multidrug transporter EmrE-like cation transporter
MKTSVMAIVMFIVAALFGAVGQYLYKTGAERAAGGIVSYLLNVPLMAGVVCYLVVMVLFVAAFKAGGSMSVLYPIYASTFIWGAIIARVAFQEPIHAVNISGMVVLIVGMYLMVLGK